MGIFLNRGNEEYKRALNSKIYVDKTEMIKLFNEMLGTEQACVCVSRPRRFGKTMDANMLAAYFEKGSDSRSLFADKKIAQTDDWDKNLNRFDVIRFDMADVRATTGTPEAALDYIDRTVIREVSLAWPGAVTEECCSIADALMYANEQSGAQFIIIIDEWDCFFRDEKGNTAVLNRYTDLLRGLFKGNRSKKFVALAYITGILPIKKYNSESALNNFAEYTMLDPAMLADYIGFRESDVVKLCEKHGMDMKDLKEWYDGYMYPGCEHIYGPNSVVMALLRHGCMNYWSQTVAFNSLADYITMNFDGLKDAVIAMLAGAPQKVKVTTYANDMTSFRSKNDVMTLLIHLGYLAYDRENGTAYIPNREVRMCFEDTLEATDWTEVTDAIDASEKLLKKTLAGDSEAVAEAIEECHRRNTSIIKYNDENSLACVIGLAYYTARREYTIIRELPAGEGFADLVFIPKQGTAKPAMIVELKWDRAAETAISQIKEKKYPEALKDYMGKNGSVLLVGISYEKDDRHGKSSADIGVLPSGSVVKKHTCVIEKI